MNEEIMSVLEPQEEIVWQDIVNRKVLVLNLVISWAVLLIIFVVFFSGSVVVNFLDNERNLGSIFVSLIFPILAVVFPLLAFFSNYVKRYIITNKRVLIRSGLIGTDFNSVYFTEVKTVNVNVGLIDKIFAVGTINIDTGKIETVTSGSGENRQSRTQTAYDSLLHIDKPYEVYKYFQSTLTQRQESLYSGRADRENNPEAYNNK